MDQQCTQGLQTNASAAIFILSNSQGTPSLKKDLLAMEDSHSQEVNQSLHSLVEVKAVDMKAKDLFIRRKLQLIFREMFPKQYQRMMPIFLFRTN